MNTKLFLCIAMGVFVAHLAVFMIYFRASLNFDPPKPTPPPTFQFAEQIVSDAATHRKIVNREFTITTRLASPGTYKGRADKPVNE